jgi:hypothetical protein
MLLQWAFVEADAQTPHIGKEIIMRAHLNRIAVLVALAIFAVCAGATPVVAQDAFRGTFNLPNEVQWQGTKLPAGAYSISLASTSVPARITLKGPGGTAFVLTSSTSRHNTAGSSVITLERHHGKSYVKDIYLQDLNLHLCYRAPKNAEDRELAQGATPTEQILVASLRK